MDESAHDVLLLQRFEQLVLELVGNGIAALGQLTNLQCVAHIVVHAATDGVPERLLVGIAGGAALVVNGRRGTVGLADQHGVGHLVHLTVQLLGAFHALNGVAHVGDFLLHALVLGGVLGAHNAVLTLVLIQESLRLLPQIGTLLTHFQNLTHTVTSCFLPRWA